MWTRSLRREEFLEQQRSELRGSEGEWLAQQLTAGDNPGPSPVKQAEDQLVEAVAAKNELRAAGETLRGQIEQEARAVEDAQRRVKEAAAKVLLPLVGPRSRSWKGPCARSPPPATSCYG